MDRLTQLQDAVDQVCAHFPPTLFQHISDKTQLAQQFVASIHFAHKRHDLETLGPNDKIRTVKAEEEQDGAQTPSPLPPPGPPERSTKPANEPQLQWTPSRKTTSAPASSSSRATSY